MKKITLSAPKSSQNRTDIISSQPAQSVDIKKANFGKAGHQTKTSSEEKPEPISQSLHSIQDIDAHAVLFFSSFSKNLYQLPIFEQSNDKVLESFTFQAFLDQLKCYRSGGTDKIPEILIVVGKLYRKDLQSWLKLSMKELFTWSDIYLSQILFRNNSGRCEVIADFMLNVCRFYYRFVSHSRPIQTFREFMSHPIYDHSKPYNWFALPDYVSYSQVLMALYCQQEKKPFPSALPKEFISQSNLSLIAQFQKKFSEDFPYPITMENVKIPYSLYKKCWLTAQSGSTIRPYDIEICFYFVQQQKISLNFVVDDLWTEGSTVGTNSYLNIQVIPLMKNFTIYDWKRLEIMNAILLSENNPDIIKAWKKQASKTFFYKKSPLNDGLGFLAISRADIFLSHHDALGRFYSLKGYKPIYHLVQASIINSQVTQSVLLWQTQASNKEYDNLYLNIIAHSFGNLSSYAGAILRTKAGVSQNSKHLPKLTQTMIREFPLNGILGLIAKINPKFNDLKHLTDFKSSTRQKTENNSENSCLLSKVKHLTPDQKLALSSLKPLPLHIPKSSNQVILNLEKSKPLQDLMAHQDTIFINKSTRLDLGALSEKLQNKQGVFAFQISQNPKFAASAIQDLNALIINSTQKINPNGLVAAHVLDSIPQEEWEKSTAYPDLNFLLSTSPPFNLAPLPKLPGETISVGEINDSELEDGVGVPVQQQGQQQGQQALGNSQAESEEMKVDPNDELRVNQGAQDNGMNQTGLTRVRAQRDLDQPDNDPEFPAENPDYDPEDFFNDIYGEGGAVASDLETEIPPTEL